MATQVTAVLIKSTGLPLAGRIFDRLFYADGLTIVRAQKMVLTPDQIDGLYKDHVLKPYFDDLVDSVNHGVIAMALDGGNAVQHWRELMGPTNPKSHDCRPNHIRWWAKTQPRMADNLVHGSDSLESADRELSILFGSAWVQSHLGGPQIADTPD